MNILITGGAGFIGTNAATYFLKKGDTITVLDNFQRKGSEKNADHLKVIGKSRVSIVKADIRHDILTLEKIARTADFILHLAGQVAVTTSVINPRDDFEANALGTFNVLEATRKSKKHPFLIFSSTNKVYGHLDTVAITERKNRYGFKNLRFGVSEQHNLDFHSPYGCSKGSADQYVRDYHRIYGLDTVVFRQSCIYGPHQFGIEDQGWVAWFIIAILLKKKITIYGNGKQVRDILHVDDLLRAYDQAYKKRKKTAGQIYNIGGGIDNTLSIWCDFRPILEDIFKKEIPVTYADWRPGDQPIYISDIRKAENDFGWKPKIGVESGIRRLAYWVMENRELFK